MSAATLLVATLACSRINGNWAVTKCQQWPDPAWITVWAGPPWKLWLVNGKTKER
jgi:hypothetical protein